MAIDDVRIISNRSTGALGHKIAQYLIKEKAKVTVLEGPVTDRLTIKPSRVIKFQFFDEFAQILQKELKKKYNIVVHAAAVSDYRLTNNFASKLSSEFSCVKLNLVPTVKLIDRIKRISPKSILVGFKLESGVDKELLLVKAHNLMKKARCDFVVANTVSDKKFNGYILDQKRRILSQTATRDEIAKNLVSILKARI